MAEVVPIQKSEVKSWEDRFKKDVYPFVKFMKSPLLNGDEKPEEGESESKDESDVTMQLYSGESGIEATWFGKILLQDDNFIYWEFSLNRNPFIKSNIVLDEDTLDILKKLFDYYSTWKTYWLQALSSKSTMVQEAKGKNRNSKFIIENHSDRMRKLAGL
jgi:hypothetical protein